MVTHIRASERAEKTQHFYFSVHFSSNFITIYVVLYFDVYGKLALVVITFSEI